jgi:hypothetical protein
VVIASQSANSNDSIFVQGYGFMKTHSITQASAPHAGKVPERTKKKGGGTKSIPDLPKSIPLSLL